MKCLYRCGEIAEENFKAEMQSMQCGGQGEGKESGEGKGEGSDEQGSNGGSMMDCESCSTIEDECKMLQCMYKCGALDEQTFKEDMQGAECSGQGEGSRTGEGQGTESEGQGQGTGSMDC